MSDARNRGRTPKHSIVVEVLREDDGKIFSQVRDTSLTPPYKLGEHACVVIDRQRGRMLDHETVQNRAQYLAACLGVKYVEDLHWPCRAARGFRDCQCPECAKRGDSRK